MKTCLVGLLAAVWTCANMAFAEPPRPDSTQPGAGPPAAAQPAVFAPAAPPAPATSPAPLPALPAAAPPPAGAPAMAVFTEQLPVDRSRFWVSGEYLLWWIKDPHVPAV